MEARDRESEQGAPHGSARLAEHLFRHEAGRMVSVLTRIFGTANLHVAEDVVQETLIQAMQTWKLTGPPDNPPAWLFRVAKNKAIDVIRRQRRSVRGPFHPGDESDPGFDLSDLSDRESRLLNSEYTAMAAMDALWTEESIEDDLLGMMFACCHPGLGAESQITLILKTLCGFSTAEIAAAFLASEDVVSKRLYRAKEFFRQERIKPKIPADHELQERLEAVLAAVYLLFNEGYRSTHVEAPIRTDLMGEAMLLGRLLAENPHTRDPRVFALMALMCFHASRSEGRLTPEGELILLPDQDRGAWNFDLIREGDAYMVWAASGDSVSRYHLEAAIASVHCTAASFETTDWPRILGYYEWLCRIARSPMTDLNRLIVVLQIEGPGKALAGLEALPDQESLRALPLYHGLLGEIRMRLGETEPARQALESAIRLTQSEAERKVLRDKLGRL